MLGEIPIFFPSKKTFDESPLLLEMTTTTNGGGALDELASRLDRLGFFVPKNDEARRRGDDFDDDFFTETDSESDWSDAEQKESDQHASRYERPTLARASGGQGRPWASKARRKKFVESRKETEEAEKEWKRKAFATAKEDEEEKNFTDAVEKDEEDFFLFPYLDELDDGSRDVGVMDV